MMPRKPTAASFYIMYDIRLVTFTNESRMLDQPQSAPVCHIQFLLLCDAKRQTGVCIWGMAFSDATTLDAAPCWR